MITEAEIKRLIQIKDSGDFGIYTLAVYALLEHLLRAKYNAPFKASSRFPKTANYGYSSFNEKKTFWKLFSMYRDDFFFDHRDNPDALKVAPIVKNHDYSLGYDTANAVRHDFRTASKEAASYATTLLKAVFEAEKSANPALDAVQKSAEELFEILEYWDRTSKNAGNGEEMRALEKKIRELEKNAADVIAYRNALSEKQREIARLEKERNEILQKVNENAGEKQRADELKIRLVDAETELKNAQNAAESYIEKNAAAEECLSFMAELLSYSSQRSRYERYLMKFSDDQQAVLDRIDFWSDFFIKGAAGTGKSIVLIKAMQKAQAAGKSTKLLTFSSSLTKYNAHISALISGAPISKNVTTVRSFVNRLLKKYLGQKSIDDMFFKKHGAIFGEAGETAFDEAKNVIWAYQLSEKQYLLTSHSSIALKDKNARSAVWEAVQNAQREMEALDEIPEEYAVVLLLKVLGKIALDESDCTDCSFVDEVQDIYASALSLIKKTTRSALIAAGDSGQSIFRTGGIEGVAEGEIRTNFRNTRQIFRLAEAYRGTDSSDALAFRPGLPVDFYRCKTGKLIMEKIGEKIAFYRNTFGYKNGDVCVIFPLKSDLEAMGVLLKEKWNLDSMFISDRAFSFEDDEKIRLCTLSACKGLDFPVVLFGAYRLRIHRGADADERHRNMIYVALTRAMEKLDIFVCEKTDSAPIIALEQAFEKSCAE